MRDTIHFLFRDHGRCGMEHRSDSCTLDLIKVSWKMYGSGNGVQIRCEGAELEEKLKVQLKSTSGEHAESRLDTVSFLTYSSKTKQCSASLRLPEHFVSQPPSNSSSLAWLTAVKRKTETEAILTFDSRLWSCLKQQPAARTRAVFVHCGVKPVSMNLTAVQPA